MLTVISQKYIFRYHCYYSFCQKELELFICVERIIAHKLSKGPKAKTFLENFNLKPRELLAKN